MLFRSDGMTVIIFRENVTMNHPDLYMECDELIVYLKDSPEGEDGKAAPVGEGGIDHAVARGREVYVEKKNPEGKAQIGQARHVTYEGDSGDLILRDFPQVLSDGTLHKAKSRDTVMIIKQNGRLATPGQTQTKIRIPQKNSPALKKP